MVSRKDFIGQWRIIEMDTWDRDVLDDPAPAMLTIEKDGMGTISFISVEAWIDYRIVTRDGLPAVEFSFQGNDAGDLSTGRAWAVLEGDRLRGRFFFHMGDDSSLVAERVQERQSRRKTPKQ